MEIAVVIIIVLLATTYVLLKIRNSLKPDDESCGGCNGCDAPSPKDNTEDCSKKLPLL